MDVMMVSNSPYVGSGYGQQTAQLLRRMKRDGHNVALSANYGAQVMMEWEGIPIYAEGMIRYANDSGPENIIKWTRNGGIGLTLFDVWVGVAPEWHTLPIVAWVPVDHDPVPPPVLEWCVKGGNKMIVAMSHHGYDALLKGGVPADRLVYIPHAIDTEVYKDNGKAFREQMRVPMDAHLTSIVAMNKGKRKSYPEMLRAWVEWSKDKPDAYLYMHTERWGHAEQAINLIVLLNDLGADEKRIRWANNSHMRDGIPPETMANVYSASDVLLATSRGEGYGLPVVEAQLCGTPVLVTNWTAQNELTGPYGQMVEGQVDWDDTQRAWWKIPNVEAIKQGLQNNYDDTKAGRINRAEIRDFAMRYDADKIYEEKWKPLLADIASGKIKLGAPEPALVPVNRAARRAR
jgi:glycosyltransferase involved in cell wall biosynthesis